MFHLGRRLGKDVGCEQFAGDCVDLLKCALQMLMGLGRCQFPLRDETVDLVEYKHRPNVLQPRLPQHCMSLQTHTNQ